MGADDVTMVSKTYVVHDDIFAAIFAFYDGEVWLLGALPLLSLLAASLLIGLPLLFVFSLLLLTLFL